MSTEPEELATERANPDVKALLIQADHDQIAHRAAMETGLAPAMPALALAQMTEPQFLAMVRDMKLARARVRIAVRELMTKDVHYRMYKRSGAKEGEKPKDGDGPRPALTQDGAGLLRQLYGLVAVPEPPLIIYGDGKTAAPFTVHARVRMHRGSEAGPVVAVGIGACSSWEKKYRYRDASRTCPACGDKTGALRKSRYEAKGGPYKGLVGTWFCWEAKGGCGAEFSPEEPTIIEQSLGQVDNPDPAEQLNTYVKIAVKRGTVHGTITATNTEDLFMHDVEERPEAYGLEEDVNATLNDMYQSGGGAPVSRPANGTGRVAGTAGKTAPAPQGASPVRNAPGNPPRGAQAPAAPVQSGTMSGIAEPTIEQERRRFYNLLGRYKLGTVTQQWVEEHVRGWLARADAQILKLTAREWWSCCAALIAEYGPPEDQVIQKPVVHADTRD